MDSLQLALLALLIGVVLGVAAAISVVAAYRLRDHAAWRAQGSVPSGMRDVLAGMDDPAIAVDATGTVVCASPAAATFGLTEGARPDAEELLVLDHAARAGTAPDPVSVRMSDASARPHTLVARAHGVGTRLTLIVLRDVSEQERVERLRRDFVANTSHELKTPAAAVSLLSEALEQAADDPEQVRDYARRLQGEAARLGALTERIMSLSRLQSEQPLDREEVLVDAVVSAAVQAQVTLAEAAGVRVVRAGSRKAIVMGDRDVLIEAVGNVLANAIAHSPEGGRVGIGVRSEDGIVDIAITDQGPGIAPADQERVFERFYRADRGRSRRTGGTGLGLAIVKHAVARYGGDVRLWSRPGQGTTFTIRLPAAATPDRARAKKRARKDASR